jgi:hypothetical protein
MQFNNPTSTKNENKNMTTPDLRKSIGRPPLRRSFLLTVFALALTWLALSPQARAVCQQGCDLSHDNTFLGDDALVNNTNGLGNTATGGNALLSNTVGLDNTANGFDALLSNTAGLDNTATGVIALLNNTTGSVNTATGVVALQSNTTGDDNTATGGNTLEFNTTGDANTANGYLALFNNTTGSNNIALGYGAGQNLTTGNSNIDIGNLGVAGESRTIRIGTKGTHGHTAIAGISGVTVAAGVGVIIDTSGHLGTVVSSEHFKDNIKPMDKTSEAILSLKPVTFRYKKALDPKGISQFGLVAEEVEKVNPDLVARNEQGKPYTVRYDAVNAMLLNEFLKEHGKVEQLEATVANLVTTVKEQASEMQKVRAQLEMSKPAPQTVLNDQ